MQLWTNLIDNAVKFSPDGGTVCVALRAERRRATARLRGEDVAVVEVSDEGPGIAAEAKERIFEKFYQADSSRASEGNGLGLALCKRIAELHGGTIEADNGTNGGAVFKVRIPLHDNT